MSQSAFPGSDSSASYSFRDVRMRGFQDRTEVTDVVELLRSRLVPLSAETVDLHDAARRVLAEDVRSEVSVPSFSRAAMDGYALCGSETFGATSYSPLELEVIGVVLPGKPFAGSLVAGQAVRRDKPPDIGRAFGCWRFLLLERIIPDPCRSSSPRSR